MYSECVDIIWEIQQKIINNKQTIIDPLESNTKSINNIYIIVRVFFNSQKNVSTSS